jgi:hypothetical protein
MEFRKVTSCFTATGSCSGAHWHMASSLFFLRFAAVRCSVSYSRIMIVDSKTSFKPGLEKHDLPRPDHGAALHRYQKGYRCPGQDMM